VAPTDFLNALRDREEISITVKGRRTGREARLPVWFVLQGRTIWLLPLHGSRTQWCRNVLVDPLITLKAGRQALKAKGLPRRAQRTVQRTMGQFRKKYSAELVARYDDHSDVVIEVPIHARGSRDRPKASSSSSPRARGQDRALHPVAASRLGPVEGLVRLFDQRLGDLAFPAGRDPETCRDHPRVAESR